MEIGKGIEIVDLCLFTNNILIISDVHMGYEEAVNKQGRNLEREIASTVRGVAKEIVEKKIKNRRISVNNLERYLGPERYFSDIAERTSIPGVATGLAWTPVGGDILFIEASKMHGKGELNLTGKLGDVMKESATAARSYLRANPCLPPYILYLLTSVSKIIWQ
jgi:ATP-dependent Lon protease